jgi:hypothetical protein
MEETMANLEKHTRRPIEPVDEAGFSAVQMSGRSPRLVCSYGKSPQNDVRGRSSAPEYGAHAVVLQLGLPATPRNVERIRERVRVLNRRLAASGTPFQLRMIS